MNDIVSILGVQNVTECALVSAVTLCLNVVLNKHVFNQWLYEVFRAELSLRGEWWRIHQLRTLNATSQSFVR